MIKNKNIFFYLCFMLTFSAFAETVKIPCRNKDGSIGLNSLDSFDCKLASKISSDPQIKKEYKNHIEKKIAVVLTNKTSDLIEDLSLLDSYFDQNKIDLGKNVDVEKNCKLEVIAQAVCKKPISAEQRQKKLSFLLSSDKYLPKSNVNNNNLYQRMISKANQIRNGELVNQKNKCPLDGDSGHFTLNSQFTVVDADLLIGLIQKGGQDSTLAPMYEKFPQLKMLISGDDDSLKKKFELEMMKYSKPAISKNFVDDFFKREETQLQMANSVAESCKKLKDNISKFVCEDNYPHLSMNEDDRDELLDGDEDDKVFKEVARGLSCEIEEKNADSSVKLFTDNDSIHQKINFYKKDNRPGNSKGTIKESVGAFCSIYLCNSEFVKPEMLSCKNGGPLSSKDILLSCPTKGTLLSCDGKIQKYYEFIASMERDAKNSGIEINGIASGSQSSEFSEEQSQKPRGYSTFYQNFLGVEGTLAAEGKKITPVTIAEKKAEFVEKKIDISSSQTGSLTRGKETVAVEVRPEPIAREMVASESDEHLASIRQADEYRRAFQSQNFSKPNYEINKDANGKTKKVKFTDTDSSTIDEMKKLRTELADALGKVKGTDDEQLAAIADNNASVVAPQAQAKSTAKSLSSGEKERLDAYRDSLNNWENKLRDWQENISDRQVRANNGGSAVNADGRSDIVAPNGDQANNRGSAGGAKLTKSGAPGPAGVNGKGDGSAERAPGTDGSDIEAGIVNSEKLATLEKESLKKLGIVVTDSFIIKVRHKEKIYSVPVKTYNHGGKEMYVPLLNDKDRELSKIVYESPLFKDYREFQVQRQYKLEQIQ